MMFPLKRHTKWEKRQLKTNSNIMELIFKKGDIFVFIGSGNNGGDGLVLAKLLLEKNIRAKVYCMKNPEDLKNEAALAYKDFKESGGVYSLYSNEERIDLNHASIIVDALLGLGTVGELKENCKKLVAFLNESKVPVPDLGPLCRGRVHRRCPCAHFCGCAMHPDANLWL